LDPGQVVSERFEIVELASAGGMGRVYRARDRQSGVDVAIKVLTARSPRDVSRFLREARVLATLAHPGIVRYVSHGETARSEPFLAMEWLQGESLADRLGRTRLSLSESVALAERAAEALGVAHARGVVHRDVKPSNLFLVGGDVETVKVLDFGIARSGEIGTSSGTGRMIGTPGYMAPEQARGLRDLDARADVFALGCVLFECLTGRPAFLGDHVMAVLAKILVEEVPRARQLAPEVPRALDALVRRMMSKERANRPSDGAEVLRELAAVRLGDPSSSLGPTESGVRALTAVEQRLLSVVLAGGPAGLDAPSDPLAPTLVPEPPYATDELREVVHTLGGSLEQVADGSVVVTLAGTAAATDQAAAAARCALALRALLPSAPMALVTGRGMVESALPIGEVIDRAALLLGSAPDARATGPTSTSRHGRKRALPIAIDEVTAGLLDVRFDVGAESGRLMLRGERERVEATRTLLGKPSTFVGRQRELSVLVGLFEECIDEPVARAVLVTGAPGVGKSRLRYEFMRRVRERGARCELLIGRGDPMSARSPFGLIAPALRRSAGILEGEPLEVRRQKLRARVGRHLGGEDAGRVSDFLGELVGAAVPADQSVQLAAARLDPMLMGDQMRRAWQDFLSAECAAEPVLIVLEDLHWGDWPSVQLVDAALRHCARLPLMVLAVARPEVHQTFPGIWQGRPLEELRLRELTRSGSERLVKSALGNKAAPEVIERIVAQASGNPFYLEELLRAVVDGKGDALPETVLSMVHARLERLEPLARRVLRAASIFGQVFWEGGVRHLLGDRRGGAAIEDWMRTLVDREVVARRGEGKFPGEREYVFRHELLREAAYATLTLGDRELGHRLAAEWLARAGESEPVVLAEHFERGGEPSRAVDWYRRAAEQALEGNDLTAAVAHAQRGLECDLASDKLGLLRLIQAEAHRWRGAFDQAERCGAEAMQLLERGTEPWLMALSEVAAGGGRLGDHLRLEALAREILQLAPTTAEAPALVTATSRLCKELLLAGQRALADRCLSHVEPIAREAAEARPAVAVALEQALAARALCRADPAGWLTHSLAALRACEEISDLRNGYQAAADVGHGWAMLGDYQQAEQVLREALASAERTGLHNVAAQTKTYLGFALLETGELAEARRLEEESVSAAVEQGNRRLEGLSRVYLCRALAQLGDLEPAAREAEAAVAILATPAARAAALAALSRVRLLQRDVAAALTCAEEAAALLESMLGEIEEGEAGLRLVHAEALEQSGRPADARTILQAAAARLHERAQRIADPAQRQRFLERIPDHARTLELARATGEVAATASSRS
jgi:tetratricopeptide (TPR) repeat protein